MQKTLGFKYVLTDDKLKKYISRSYFKQYLLAKQGNKNMSQVAFKKLALAIKKWAVKNGATYFTHWFYSVNNQEAEKYVCFPDSKQIDQLSASEILQTRVDASSLVSCKTIKTHNGQGIVSLDFQTPAFIMQQNNVKILYLPSTFSDSYGNALDYKLPLNRSCKLLNDSVCQFLKLMGHKNVKSVYSTLGCEQEYFLIDKCKSKTRIDLQNLQTTIFGKLHHNNMAAKKHYMQPFSSTMQTFMQDLNSELFKVGIPVKLQHGEVSQNQFEVVPQYVCSNLAATQNLLLTKIIKNVAQKHKKMVLLNEKPFCGLSGSGKHNNWSIETNKKINLLDYTKVNGKIFLAVFSAILAAVDKYHNLLMAAVTSFSNSFRLGENEAPSTIFSVYIGPQLTNKIKEYLKTGKFECDGKNVFKYAICAEDTAAVDNRNRTSTFAFNQNKFEFRAVGASQNVSLVNTILNTIVAQEILNINSQINSGQHIDNIIKQNLLKHFKIVYNGNCYSNNWQKIAYKRKIKNYKNNPNIYQQFTSQNIRQIFINNSILNCQELSILQQSLYSNYYAEALSYAQTFCAMLNTQILPSLYSFMANQKRQHDSNININQTKNYIKNLQNGFNNILQILDDINLQNHIKQQCKTIYFKLLPAIKNTRNFYDAIEPIIPRAFLPFNTYNDILNV